MKAMKLSPERSHLLKQTVRKNMQPLEIVICTIFATVLFVYVFLIIASKFRHEDMLLAYLIGPVVAGVIAIVLTVLAVKRRRNLFINLAVCAWIAMCAGLYYGERSYWKYTTSIYSYRDLASYVNIDPARDRGLSYMDSGHVYFKEHSKVNRQMVAKFLNGVWYCVAPIVRGSVKSVPVKDSTATIVEGYVIPESGTYDWWAVGTNCCGDQKNFTCGQAEHPMARTGMRILSDTERPFYLLAVQQWSATFGLPVRHPLFFTWVVDPMDTEDRFDREADSEFWTLLWYVVLVSFVVSFLLHMALHRNKIY